MDNVVSQHRYEISGPVLIASVDSESPQQLHRDYVLSDQDEHLDVVQGLLEGTMSFSCLFALQDDTRLRIRDAEANKIRAVRMEKGDLIIFASSLFLRDDYDQFNARLHLHIVSKFQKLSDKLQFSATDDSYLSSTSRPVELEANPVTLQFINVNRNSQALPSVLSPSRSSGLSNAHSSTSSPIGTLFKNVTNVFGGFMFRGSEGAEVDSEERS